MQYSIVLRVGVLCFAHAHFASGCSAPCTCGAAAIKQSGKAFSQLSAPIFASTRLSTDWCVPLNRQDVVESVSIRRCAPVCSCDLHSNGPRYVRALLCSPLLPTRTTRKEMRE